MSDLFAKKSKKEFVEYASGLLEMMAQTFPECAETKATHARCVELASEEQRVDDAIDAWLAHLNTPLNGKKIKYAKAIERIIKSPATVMHALTYHDVEGIQAHMDSPLAKQLGVFDKVADERVTDADKKVMWKFLEKMASSAFEAVQTAPPPVPTRQEIQENIKNRKKETTDDGPPSMQRAFQTHINAMCKSWGQSAVLDGDEVKVKAWMERWASFAQRENDGKKNSALCNARDFKVLVDLRRDFPELKVPADDAIEESVWVNICQLNSFSTVVDSIPTGMMGRIETMASKLADDIIAGRTDMASVNLNDIGQQVLSQCGESEMDKFADNIETLLPALQNFQSQMPSIPGMPMPAMPNIS